MDIFEYKRNETTEDDIVEHILMRLNNDFEGCALSVPDFCSTSKYDYDHIMVVQVIEKMLEHSVAKISTGTGQDENAIELKAKGAKVYKNGGWKKYLNDYEIEQAKVKERANQRPNSININAPVIGSQIGQDSRFGSLSSNISTNPHNPHNPQADITPKKKSGQWTTFINDTTTKIIAFITALIAFVTKLLDLW